jgi:predicted nucleotidyltransferase
MEKRREWKPEDIRGEMMGKTRIVVPKERIEELCRKYHIRRLSLFGSVITPDFKPESDVDVLVEFEAGRKVGLLKMAHIENELSALLGRKVDLRTPGDLSRYFRQEVIENAEVQYAQG